MKLILITAIKSFELEIKRLLKMAQVKAYTFNEAIGYKDTGMEALSENWFATNMHENESLVFFAFAPESHAQQMMSLVAAFNQEQETESKVHIALLNIETN